MPGTINLLSALAAVFLLAALWLYRINKSMQAVPEEAAKAFPGHWSSEEIRETYERLKKTPTDFAKHLPPKLDRRYVVFGGAGMVGGDIVLQLLLRGQSPESIRIVDFQLLNRRDMLEKAAPCDFVKADMTSLASVEAAFSKEWPASVAKKPLTVYHTAAMIQPGDRSERLYERIRRVNVDGTANVMRAAKGAGADIFVATSSASVSYIPADVWVWPWQSIPGNYFHVASEADFFKPIRPHNRFFANYSRSKAEGERLVCGANHESFRTGTIRPGNGIYGQKTDPILGSLLKMGDSATWIPHIIQDFVDSRNVALAHLFFEAALAQKAMPACAGRPFVVTDPGPPVAFADMYKLVTELSTTPVSVLIVPPVALLIVAHLIEAYISVVTRFPSLTATLGLKEPSYPINFLQPSVIRGSMHILVDDSAAKKSAKEGGIGYHGVCNSLEGFCEELLEWNREHEDAQPTKPKVVEALGKKAKGLGA
ncbi:hypothetical protein OQA88_1604 [Cercophora sp. LCS_1]